MSRHPVAGFREAERRFAATFGDMRQARRWWVPGRIELLGKHVDYGGGRSLLTAVDRGFHVIARPRTDHHVHLVDARTGVRFDAALDAATPTRPGHWTNYPLTVLRRVARDFPAARSGADLVVASSLPSAAGLSSSSALVIATFLPIAAINNLPEGPEWRAAIADADALAGYLGALENGRAFGPFPGDFGVGTQGGSQDHTAILRCRLGELAQYRFLPVRDEGRIPLPAGWCFVVAASGVIASKGGAVQQQYNALAAETAELLELWRSHEDPAAISLLSILEGSSDAVDRLHQLIESHGSDPALLTARLGQFQAECREIIPAVASAFRANDPAAAGDPVDRSQRLAETVLRNQVPETTALVELARQQGAAAASAFGAGFGGSVWAMVPETGADEFAQGWRRRYLTLFPNRHSRAEVFVARSAAGAGEQLG